MHFKMKYETLEDGMKWDKKRASNHKVDFYNKLDRMSTRLNRSRVLNTWQLNDFLRENL